MIKILTIIMVVLLVFKLQQVYYIFSENNELITFVVKLKNKTYYMGAPKDITRDELIERVVRISGKEETNITGIYNIYGTELEYVEGVWVEK